MTYWFNDSGAFGVKRGAIMSLSLLFERGQRYRAPGERLRFQPSRDPSCLLFLRRSLLSGISNSVLAGWSRWFFCSWPFASRVSWDPGAIAGVGEPDVIVSAPVRPANRSAEEAMEGPVQANVLAALRGFHFAMQPYGRAPPLSNPSLVSASNPGGPHFCVFSFSLSVCLSLAHLALPLTFFFPHIHRFFFFGILRVSLLNSFCLPSHSVQHAKGWNIVF